MPLVAEICQFLDAFAPPILAEEWDNVGLLVGDARQPVERVMTCLTITPASCAEAASKRADLIVTHHPLPFKPLRRLTTDNTPGRLLLASRWRYQSRSNETLGVARRPARCAWDGKRVRYRRQTRLQCMRRTLPTPVRTPQGVHPTRAVKPRSRPGIS